MNRFFRLMAASSLADKFVLAFWICLALLFACLPALQEGFSAFTAQHALVAGFCKFAVLATFGECVAQRLVKGAYLPPAFGLIPRAVIWGVLGMTITVEFLIFSGGVPVAMAKLGLPWAATALGSGSFLEKLAVAFSVSVAINLIFSPVLMVAHKMCDIHIETYQGRISCLWTKPDPEVLLKGVNWSVMWNFVLAKTVPLFWIPAHTITFMLPEGMRVLFAAILGAALGVILAWAGMRKRD